MEQQIGKIFTKYRPLCRLLVRIYEKDFYWLDIGLNFDLLVGISAGEAVRDRPPPGPINSISWVDLGGLIYNKSGPF